MINKNSTMHQMKSLMNLIKRKFDACEAKKDSDNLIGTRGYILGFLCHNQNKDIFQRDIEEEFSIRRSTATSILQLMEKNELITRVSVDYDARLKKIVLSQKAIGINKEIEESLFNIEKTLLKNISDSDLETFKNVILQMKKNIEERNCFDD